MEALEAVLPADIPHEEIAVRMGSNWVPPSVVKDFICTVVSNRTDHFKQLLKVEYDLETDHWTADIEMSFLDGDVGAGAHSTPRKSFTELVNAGLNQQQVKIYDYVTTGDGRRKAVENKDETEAANEKLDMLKQRFKAFLWADPARAAMLARIYNDRFNSHVRPTPDGSHLTFPGMSSTIQFRPHQKNGVWRAVCFGNALLNHEVGTGKTMLMVATAMEKRRLGLAAKPMVIVKNHMIEQIEREARQLYPDAKILAVSKEELSREGRSALMGKIANNDWDLVIITHSQFGRIGLNPRFVEREVEIQLDDLRGHLAQASDGGMVRGAVKAIEAAVKRLESKLKKTRNSMKDGQDAGMWFDEMGVDCLIVDEAHNFKNLAVAASDQSEVAGSAIGGSDKAFDLHIKIKWLYERLGKEANVVFATGTPVSNNLLEIYNLQRNLQPSMLEEMGVASANAWASNFLEPKVVYEPEVSGVGFARRLRFKLVNIPELMGALCNVMDTVKAEEVASLELPACERETVCADVSVAQADAMSDLAERLNEIRRGDVDPRVDNLLKIVSEGRKLALDMRLLDCHSEDHRDGKVNLMVGKVVDIWRETKDSKGTQLIFSDLGVHGEAFNLYKDIRKKLAAAGIPEREIAFAQDAKTDKAKGELFARVRSGNIRVLLGSTMVMGEGTNVQARLAAVHHLDAPWRPSDIEQRRGRMVRHGNIHEGVNEYVYVTEGTFDAFMWTVLKTKAENFVQVMSGRSDIRTFDMEADPTFAEALAVASNNPLVKARMEAEQEVSRLSSLARSQAKHASMYRQVREYSEYELDKVVAGRADEAGWLEMRTSLPKEGAAAASDVRQPEAVAIKPEAVGIKPEAAVTQPEAAIIHPEAATAQLDGPQGGGAEDLFGPVEDEEAILTGKPEERRASVKAGGWKLDLGRWESAGGGLPEEPALAEALRKAVLDGVDMHALRPLLSDLVKARGEALVKEGKSISRGFDLDPGLSYRGVPVALWADAPKKGEKGGARLAEWVLEGSGHDRSFKSASGLAAAVDGLDSSIGQADIEIARLRRKIMESRASEEQIAGGADYAGRLREAKQRLAAVVAEIEGAGRPVEEQPEAVFA